ncbi:Clr5 domain-containing protein [Sordaria brevicollis]|uniref:Clr5 domain-containing protein n=1 Tax=Sordaria brevicollis TaxID=83679 RepID=A0AAE0U2R0_SORBR|nr:Clr5 domain-containing protein [Sordaria brevicollis]
MTTASLQTGSSPESRPGSPSPDDIIQAFLEQQDDILIYGQSQEYYSTQVHTLPSPSFDLGTHGNTDVFAYDETYTGARLSPFSKPLAGFQQESQLPSPPESPSGSPSGVSRHRRTSSYPRKAGTSGKTHARRHTTLGTSSKGPMAHSPMVPRKAEDWEPWKSVIHQLYIVQNHILKDIIVIMENTYNFKATPKMYKNQFARWNFFKYAIKRRSPAGTDTSSDVTSPESTGESWITDQDHQSEEMQPEPATPGFRIELDSPVDAYPSHYLDDGPSAFQESSYFLQYPQDDIGSFCLDSASTSLAQQMIMNDPESKELGTKWSHRNFGPDFAQRLENLLNKVTSLECSGQLSEDVLKAIQKIYCGWMSDYYQSTQQWSEVFEWKKRGLAMTSNRQYVACSMRLEELMRDHGLTEEAEELRRKRMDIGWLMGGALTSSFQWISGRSMAF